jgi:hypothetical protein
MCFGGCLVTFNRVLYIARPKHSLPLSVTMTSSKRGCKSECGQVIAGGAAPASKDLIEAKLCLLAVPAQERK